MITFPPVHGDARPGPAASRSGILPTSLPRAPRKRESRARPSVFRGGGAHCCAPVSSPPVAALQPGGSSRGCRSCCPPWRLASLPHHDAKPTRYETANRHAQRLVFIGPTDMKCAPGFEILSANLTFEAQSRTPCNRCVRFVATVGSGHETLATKRALPLSWAGPAERVATTSDERDSR